MTTAGPISDIVASSLLAEFAEIPVVEVAVAIDAPDLLPTYSYRVPERLTAATTIGSCVHISFGGREALGYVIERRSISTSDPLAPRLRDLLGVVDGAVTFSKDQAEIARWISERYVCDLSSAVRCIAPAALASHVRTTVRLTHPSIDATAAGGAMIQAHIIATLQNFGGEADLDDLRKSASVSAFNAGYAALLRKNLISETRALTRAKVVARTVRAYDLGDSAQMAGERVSPAGARILEVLAELARAGETPVLPEKLLYSAQASMSALKTLADKGAVIVRDLKRRRSSNQIPAFLTAPPILTPGQAAASKWIRSELLRRQSSQSIPQDSSTHTALLFGVTASGKTEVYLDAISATLNADRSAIVLVPEIALTTQVVEVFTGRFGDEVAVLHSRLSEGERHDEWRRLQQSEARIAVGARSAVFAPLDNVGLIVVDEEHEASYKQESSPRYNARDVAVERGRRADAVVLLGSATPSLETYYASEQSSIARLEMNDRIGGRALPKVELVDLRAEMKENRALFSRALIDRLGDRLSRGQQTILFLNRRGYAQFILCRECGFVARCPNCAVSLAFHAAWSSLRCHHCGYGRQVPTTCPSCGGTKIKGFGIGTERVEEEVIKQFPQARIARMDRDTTSRKGAHAGILKRFRDGDADILIGTQMVAKGLDFPNVTLVGVISADTSINMPDFRAAERTFQLMTQVAGRAGRGEHPGEVVIQTFTPEHFSLEKAVDQDYRGFYEKEILFREELRYPPYSRMANLVCSDEESSGARGRAQALAAAAKSVLPKEVELIGPAPAPLVKLKNTYRWHVVLRADPLAALPEIVRAILGTLTPSDRRRVTVDIDPMNMA